MLTIVGASLCTGCVKLTVNSGRTMLNRKGYMMSRLQTLLRACRLSLPASVETLALAKELNGYETGVPDRGHGSFNDRQSSQRNLVIALGQNVGIEQQGRGRW